MNEISLNLEMQQAIVISPENIKTLEEIYGATTDACKNRIINEILRGEFDKVKWSKKGRGHYNE